MSDGVNREGVVVGEEGEGDEGKIGRRREGWVEIEKI